MKITNPYGPNTTLLLPGGCNATCSFCFWNRGEAKIKPPPDYLDKVFDCLQGLPKEFRVLSISGGEPTLSPWFGRVLSRLGQYRRSHRLDRVVLTTHGGNLAPFVTAVGCVVDHINISRHAVGTEANRKIFRTKKTPTDQELSDLILRVHGETTCDVTLNCVIRPDVSIKWCKEFIEYAKRMGADAVSFRKEASNVSPTKAEIHFAQRYGVTGKTDCPVCRGMWQKVDGFDVRWKGSVLEPSIETGGVYEVVIHPDGNAYTDWGMKVPFKNEPLKEQPKKRQNPVPKHVIVDLGYRASFGCGNSRC